MGISGVTIFNSAVDRMQETSKNLAAIQESRSKRRREDEEFELKKKKTQLEIDEAELKGQKTGMEIKIMQTLMDDMLGTEQKVMDGKDAMIDLAEHKESKKVQLYGKIAEELFNKDPQVQQYAGGLMNPGVAAGPGGGAVVGETQAGTPEAISMDIFGGARSSIKPVYSPSAGRVVTRTVSAKEDAFTKIQDARAKGIPLLPEEENFVRNQLGINKKPGEVTRKDIVGLAKDMAKEEFDNLPVDDNSTTMESLIEKHMDTAQRLLEGGAKGAGPKPAASNGSVPSEKVTVIAPDGRRGTIPREKLETALRQGFRVER